MQAKGRENMSMVQANATLELSCIALQLYRVSIVISVLKASVQQATTIHFMILNTKH